MSSAVHILALFVAASASASAAAAAEMPAQAAARVRIVEPVGLRMQWAFSMPSVRGSAQGAVFMGAMPSMAMGMMMPANARLIMRREDETGGEPVTAPTVFEVLPAREAETLVVRTGMTEGVRPAAKAIANGALPGRSAASVDVAQAGASGALVVLVQYN